VHRTPEKMMDAESYDKKMHTTNLDKMVDNAQSTLACLILSFSVWQLTTAI